MRTWTALQFSSPTRCKLHWSNRLLLSERYHSYAVDGLRDLPKLHSEHDQFYLAVQAMLKESFAKALAALEKVYKDSAKLSESAKWSLAACQQILQSA